jgi:N-acetyl-anhydromuramyl-L-alanine amidase AmpD
LINIIKPAYNWQGVHKERKKTTFIVIHHRAGDGSAESIHNLHVGRGYVGIGYHFYIRKNGEVYKGRPINSVGAHTLGENDNSIGVCFEGNFDKEILMTAAQKRSGRELIEYLKNLYPKAVIKGHRELQATACPGVNFPLDEMKKEVKNMTIDEAIEIIQAKAGLEDETIDFLLCYKYGEELIVKVAEAMR